MDESFLAALFPRRHFILGSWLRPYCHGHLAALDAVGSPFLAAPDSGASVGAGDLLLAVRVCAAPGWPLLCPDDLRPRPADVLRRWWLERRPARLRAAVQAFQNYLDDHTSFPEFWEEQSVKEDDDGQPVGGAPSRRMLSAPVALARVCALISRTTLTLAEAWTLPLAMPAWYAGTLDEMEGAHVRFLRDGDIEEQPEPEPVISERQLYAQAVRHLGRDAANAWRAARRAAAKQARRQANRKGEGVK